jgi:hypothetical protein
MQVQCPTCQELHEAVGFWKAYGANGVMVWHTQCAVCDEYFVVDEIHPIEGERNENRNSH